MRYAGPSACRAGSSGAGITPSCVASRLPPGKTCAEGKEVEVQTRWRSRISLEGEISRTLLKRVVVRLVELRLDKNKSDRYCISACRG
jgi:hypothetical protein